MIRVCHVTSAHGVEDVRIFHKECVSLVQEGYEVYLVERGESYDKNGVHIIGIGCISNSRVKRMTQGAKKAYETALSLNCDLYHLHDPELLPYAVKLKRKGKKVVFDSHELTREQIKTKPYLPNTIARLLSFIFATYEGLILRRIDGVIFPCPVNGKFPLSGKRQVFLNNVPRLSEMFEKYNPDAVKIPNSVCTIGSLTFNRGIKHLVLAAAKAQCKVYLGGILTPSAFEEEIKSMPESKNVEFLDYLSREQVREVYEKTQICVSTLLNIGQYSMMENLSTKVYEAMAMGLPVIISEQPYNKRMIDQYEFGVCVDPESIDDFSNAIRDLLDNPEKMKKMGENGRSTIKNCFNWEIEQYNLFGLYNDLFNEGLKT